ncbi:MAG: DNA-binding response OmpR family regulator, partial [Candidatus Aldehydirespiratoraceae bacterium]
MSIAVQQASILVVDDAPEFRQLLDAVLEREGFTVTAVANGAGAVSAARSVHPDVIVLDLGLPDIDGIEVCRQVRLFSDAYIIMLTARNDEADRLLGLTAGADDYMTKPFSPRELVARIQVLMRRPRAGTFAPSATATPAILHGEVRVDPTSREVAVGEVPVALTKIEFDLLHALVERPRMVWERRSLIIRVWGDDWYADDHVIDVHVANLRK